MLAIFKRWFTSVRKKSAREELRSWAHASGYRFARVQQGDGFVINGQLPAIDESNMPALPWRLEWGPSQRSYIAGFELRIRIELGLPHSLQMLLMSSSLLEMLESEIFESSTHGLETHIDMSMPEEMRWLSLFVKAPLPRCLRPHFNAVSNDLKAVGAWVDKPFIEQLQAASGTLMVHQPPFLIMTLKGRLYLRLQLVTPSQVAVSTALDLFQVAARSTSGAVAMHGTQEENWPSTAATAWQSQYSSE